MPEVDRTDSVEQETESSFISPEEAEALKPIQKKFMESYLANRDRMPIEDWLRAEMAENLPECKPAEIEEMSSGIISTLKTYEEKHHSLETSVRSGRSKESWFAGEMKQATSYMSSQETVQYLSNLDGALESANAAMMKETLLTNAGTVNRSMNLDGFIAEQYHAQTFNLNAEATGSPYRAEVLGPDGHGYGKNSVDIVIRENEGSGKIVRRYQLKYGKDADATARLFEHGDYRGQQKLGPTEQVENGNIGGKKATDRLEAPDGTTSNPLTKNHAAEMRDEAQSGNWKEMNWNEYQMKDLSRGIATRAGQAAVMGAAVGVGFNIAQKAWNGEKIDGGELVETAVVSGSDFGIKTATAGALKVGSEKGIIRIIPKGTRIETITGVVYVAAENIKVVGKVAEGELTVHEGLEKMEQATVATVSGMVASLKGAAIGKAIGTAIGGVLGPVGSVVGSFIGGTIAYAAGSKFGETVAKGAQKVRSVAKNVLKKAGGAIKGAWNRVKSGGRRLGRGRRR